MRAIVGAKNAARGCVLLQAFVFADFGPAILSTAVLRCETPSPSYVYRGMNVQDLQAQAQPFVKLAQTNIELLTRFWTSPEVSSQAMANASALFQQASESAVKVMQSGAAAQLMQGMIQNYTEFLGELGRGWMSTMSQGQAALLRQAQENTSNVIDASTARGRRVRQAA
jgi:hypothetical protein